MFCMFYYVLINCKLVSVRMAARCRIWFNGKKSIIPTGTQRNNDIIMTSKRRRFGVMMTLILRRVSVIYSILFEIMFVWCDQNWRSLLNQCYSSSQNRQIRADHATFKSIIALQNSFQEYWHIKAYATYISMYIYVCMYRYKRKI